MPTPSTPTNWTSIGTETARSTRRLRSLEARLASVTSIWTTIPPKRQSDPFFVNLRLRDSADGSVTSGFPNTVFNVVPSIENLSATDVSENGVTTLSGNIIDPGTLDTFSLEVDWGDGTVVETFTYGAGVVSFNETHRFLDDNPTGTINDVRVISVTLADDDTGEVSDTASLTIANVAPSLENLSSTDVNENGITTLTGNIVDPGSLDTFSLEVDWGDGTVVETFAYAAGTVNFSETHQYLDDDPSGTTSDTHVISCHAHRRRHRSRHRHGIAHHCQRRARRSKTCRPRT